MHFSNLLLALVTATVGSKGNQAPVLTLFSACTTERESFGEAVLVQDETTSIRIWRPSSPPKFYLTCNVSLGVGARQPQSSFCVSNTSAKIIGQPGSLTPRIWCESNHLIRVQLEFLDRAWTAVYQNTFVYSQRSYDDEGTTTARLDTNSTYTLSISPEGPVSVRYSVTGFLEADTGESSSSSGGALQNWTQDPLEILLVFSPPQTAVRGRDVALYTTNPQKDGGENFLSAAASTGGGDATDILLIPCLSSLPGRSLTPVRLLQVVPADHEHANKTSACSLLALTPPVAQPDPLHGIYLNLSGTQDYGSSSFRCCHNGTAALALPNCSLPLPSPDCLEFKIKEPPDLIVLPVMPASAASGEPLRLFWTQEERRSGSRRTVRLVCSFTNPVKLKVTLHKDGGEGRSNPPGPTSTPLDFTLVGIRTRTSHRGRFEAVYEARLESFVSLSAQCVRNETDQILYNWTLTSTNADADSVPGNSSGPNYLKWGVHVHEGSNSPEPHTSTSTNETKAQKPLSEVVRCSSDVYDDVVLKAIGCHNSAQGGLMGWCLEAGADECGQQVSGGTSCRRAPGTNSSSSGGDKFCQHLQIPGPGGLVRCTVARGQHEYTQLRWVGLSGNNSFLYREDDWRNATKDSEMVRVGPGMPSHAYAHTHGPNQAPGVYYTRMEYNFSCFAHSFWSGGRVRFFFGRRPRPRPSAEFSNSTVAAMVLAADDEELEPAHGAVWVLDYGPFRQIQTLVFPSSTVERVVCRAPVHGRERAWIWDSVPVRVKEYLKPAILNRETHFELEAGARKEIRCDATGAPPPHIRWSTKSVNGLEVLISAKPVGSASNDSSMYVVNGSTLVLDQFTRGMEGVYTCTATGGNNTRDQVSKPFRVALKGTRPDTALWQWVGLGVGGVGFVILVLVFTLLLRTLMLKYRRVLSQIDVDAFRYGTNAANTAEPSHGDPLTPPASPETGPSLADLEGAPCDSCTVESQPLPAQQSSNWVSDVESKPFDTKFEISRKKFTVDKTRELGSGEFGVVYLGKAELDDGDVAVAVKIPGKNCPEPILKGMLKELKIMSPLQHENLVSLVRAHTSRIAYGDLFILMEYCEEGSLEQFFERRKCDFVSAEAEAESARAAGSGNAGVVASHYAVVFKFGVSQLVRWCAQVAAGMEYLAAKGVVHRDLAARNILLTREWSAKISDFGLSRQLYGRPTYEHTNLYMKLPFRWMALECFTGTFSSSSDVWAFGILAWEIFSLGQLPYTNIDVKESAQFVQLLRQGLRISETAHAPPRTFEMLKECWSEYLRKRPSFTRLKDFFNTQMESQ